MIRQYELVERVRAYDPQADENLLNRAYVFSMKAHGSQKRASGDPYFSHPLEVAAILTDMHLDESTIAVALLHDTIEDTVATYEDIEKMFGPKIAQLVDGVTKLSKLERPASESARQAENFRKLLVAMSNDIRVLLVKLADRLHNMRTLHFIKDPEKRKRIAVETMEIYAPLAERIGMQEMREELEDLAFAQINPDARAGILARLEFLREKGGTLIPKVSEQLHRTLVAGGVDCAVHGREKRPYSIWRKMEEKNISFEQLSDIMAFRVIVHDVGECYRALGVIHAAYPMVHGRFKDYISTPKRNGYRSLHTTVIGPERQKIEVQIRTREMQEIAELGVAAHWHYKEGAEAPPVVPTDGMQYRWLRELLEILEHASTPEEFLEHTKLEMFQDQVFCFTPRGDLIALPTGATPLDFAYAVHTSVGHTCVGAKINGRLQPLRTELRNGDQVEIVRSKAQTPSADWENLVVTGHARSAIRRFLRGQQRDQYLALGKEIIAKAFQQGGHEVSEKAVEAVLRNFRQKSVEDLQVAVGQGLVTGRAVVEAVFPGEKLKDLGKVVPISRARGGRNAGKGVPIKGLIPGMAIHYAGCCHPLPGDRIVGIVSTGRGVTVHSIDCKMLEQYNDQPERWLDLAWSSDKSDGPHTGRITAVVANEPGALSTVANVIAKGMGNVVNLKFTDRTTDFVEMMIDIEVRDVKHLTTIVAALRANPAISSVERARG